MNLIPDTIQVNTLFLYNKEIFRVISNNFNEKNLSLLKVSQYSFEKNDYLVIPYNNLQELSLNSILKLMYCIEKDWTKKQREVVNYVLFEKKNQTETAHYFNVTQSNIQQILSKTHFYAYKDAFDSVNKILSEVKYDNKL